MIKLIPVLSSLPPTIVAVSTVEPPLHDRVHALGIYQWSVRHPLRGRRGQGNFARRGVESCKTSSSSSQQTMTSYFRQMFTPTVAWWIPRLASRHIEVLWVLSRVARTLPFPECGRAHPKRLRDYSFYGRMRLQKIVKRTPSSIGRSDRHGKGRAG